GGQLGRRDGERDEEERARRLAYAAFLDCAAVIPFLNRRARTRPRADAFARGRGHSGRWPGVRVRYPESSDRNIRWGSRIRVPVGIWTARQGAGRLQPAGGADSGG